MDDSILHDTDPADVCRARWWKTAAQALAEEALEELPSWHSERRGLTELLSALHLGDAALMAEYARWRRCDPEMADAMMRAGKLHATRIQRHLERE
jgi:hypothetical protein